MAESATSGAEEAIARATAVARQIVQQEIAPADGAHALWREWSKLVPLEEALRVFVGLARHWDELPGQREEAERHIVVEADRFLARFGK
jgi:hypothetical protein